MDRHSVASNTKAWYSDQDKLSQRDVLIQWDSSLIPQRLFDNLTSSCWNQHGSTKA
jgi:hypothetical protein